MLLYLRSILFNAAFYICTLVQMILYTPFYFILPRKKAWIVPELWARVNLWLQKHIAGTDCVVEGLENIPEGAYICAPKHQSAWDTYAFLPYLDDPVLILKRELMRIPLFGWYIAKMQMIPVDRGSRVKALHSITKGAEKAIAEGRQILIYPEGTRRSPGRRRNINTASCIFMRRSICLSCRLRIMPGFTGRAASSCVIPAPFARASFRPSRRGCRRKNSCVA